MSKQEPKSWESDLSWSYFGGQEQNEFIDRVNPIDGTHQTYLSTAMEKAQLPFYSDNVQLIRLHDQTWPTHLNVYYLKDRDNLFRLNGTSPPIHEVNANAPIQLNESNVLAYLRFFCFFVRGEEGPFLIFESLNQPEIPDISEAKERIELEKHAYPAQFNGINDRAHFLAAAMIWYNNALFAGHFRIQPSGLVELEEDELVLGDLETIIAPLS